MKISLSSYRKVPKELPKDLKVYSVVAYSNFSPLDMDLNRLTSELGWDTKTDRFRLWFMPKLGSPSEPHYWVCLRKFDIEQDRLIYVQITPNTDLVLKPVFKEPPPPFFIIDMLTNDDTLPYNLVDLFLDIPPAYHRKGELQIIEEEWTTDARRVSRFVDYVAAAFGSVGVSK